jgi:hypothetical protein
MSSSSSRYEQRAVLASPVTHGAPTTSFADITGLSLPMMAGTLYQFEGLIIFQSSATNRGMGLALNGPASPSFVLIRTEIATSLTGVTNGMQRAYDTGVATTTVDAANSNVIAKCYGFVSNGVNAGNLILRFNSSNTAGIPVVQAGSTFRLWRVSPL